ncbi:DUF5367 family protein [Aestuariivivens sediminicola]|uniref:DUF5367 family protein n=1 Tax=Aestuariivivens sediminicola TaxID=2913560 RepID=UPI001F589390|nr:DUF5367 family protein [Aestuariivivens sediminicola]
MKLFRTIGIGIIIWILGVSIYTISFYIPILENSELQANIFLSLGILPVVWFGTKLYYRKKSATKGYWLGLAFFLIASVMDALITVPLLIVPFGGTHYSFFTAIGFWFIGIEFMIMTTAYWYVKIYSQKKITN